MRTRVNPENIWSQGLVAIGGHGTPNVVPEEVMVQNPRQHPFQVGYIVSPDLLLLFATTVECGFSYGPAGTDLARTLRSDRVSSSMRLAPLLAVPLEDGADAFFSSNQPPQELISAFNNWARNALPADARMHQLWRRLWVRSLSFKLHLAFPQMVLHVDDFSLSVPPHLHHSP